MSNQFIEISIVSKRSPGRAILSARGTFLLSTSEQLGVSCRSTRLSDV